MNFELTWPPRMELGFVEEAESQDSLTSPLFSSKVGGRPVWPDPKTLPGTQTCEKCGKPLVLLLQIHAPLPSSPLEEEDPRVLFIFVCRDPKCHSPGDTSCFRVLRWEARYEDISGSVAPDTASTKAGGNSDTVPKVGSCDISVQSHDSSKEGEPKDKPTSLPFLCVVCGGRGPKRCSGCLTASYCSKTHQLHDWMLGHKKICSKLSESLLSLGSLGYNPSSGVVLREWDLVTEQEPKECSGKGKERSEEERMADYMKYMDKQKAQGKLELCDEVSEKEMTGKKEKKVEGKKDKMFLTFKRRIEAEPEQVCVCACVIVCMRVCACVQKSRPGLASTLFQVIRYQRGGEPLFISGNRIPTASDIPKCSCGAERKFELQVSQ